LDGSQLTISPSRWMELPDYSYVDWKKHQNTKLSSPNAGLVFSSKNQNFSEDNSLLNAHHFLKPSISTHTNRHLNLISRQSSSEESRVSMHDVKMYYRDFVKQKNLDRYLLNNATVTTVRRVYCNRFIPNYSSSSSSDNCCSTFIASSSTHSLSKNNINNSNNAVEVYWEVTGLIDKRDRKKASSLTHKGDLMEFKFFCKHLVLANGTCDLHNELDVKGENLRYILRTIKELEDTIKEDLPRLQKEPLLIVGSGLSAADAILLAQKYSIKIVHVIRRSVNDPNLVFNKLPKKIYPEYQRVYEQMAHNRYNNEQSQINNDQTTLGNYVLYDEYQIKKFTSKRTVILTKLDVNSSTSEYLNPNDQVLKTTCQANKTRHLAMQKQHHQNHQRQLKEFDEDQEMMNRPVDESATCGVIQFKKDLKNIEIKISYACILIGHSPNLDFLPPVIVNDLALDPTKPLNTKENPIGVDKFTHEVLSCSNLYAMGPLIGDNFVRFGTGGALAITSKIYKDKKIERQQRLLSLNSMNLPLMNNLILNQNQSLTNNNNINNKDGNNSLKSSSSCVYFDK
jgi:hypothetical protein